MDAYDDLLEVFAEHQNGDGESGPNGIHRPVAVGLYYFEEQSEDSYSIWNP
jgi:hypothetical protein